MSAKIKIEKLVTVIEKGMMAISLGDKESGSFSDFGRLTINSEEISVRSWAAQANSICSAPLEAGEEVVANVSFSISMPKLLGMLSSLPKDSVVTVTYDGQKTEEYVGNLVFNAGKSSWKMPCLDPKLVAEIKMDEGDLAFAIDRESITDAIGMTAFASNANDAFFTISNICVSIKDKKIYFGATDDVRCASYVVDYPDAAADKRMLIPIHYLNKVIKSFEKGVVSIFSGKSFIRLNQGSHSVKMSLPTEADINRFPAFETLVAKDFPFKLRVMTGRFKSMALACQETNREECLIKIDNNEITFYAVDKTGGMKYKSSIPYTGDKVDVMMGVCSLYLVDYLKKIKEETIQIEFLSGEGKPKFMKIQDAVGSHYIMKALIDLVNVPEDSAEEQKVEPQDA
jgi:DNA polymerase III sliding clamp (beta) subunit (PCNA family)